MTGRIREGGLAVAEPLHRCIEREILPGTGISPSIFWVYPAIYSNTQDIDTG